jgi:hypothetical protein
MQTKISENMTWRQSVAVDCQAEGPVALLSDPGAVNISPRSAHAIDILKALIADWHLLH